MIIAGPRVAAVVAVIAFATTACGNGGGEVVVRPPSTASAGSSALSTQSGTTSVPASTGSGTTSSARHPAIVITPNSSLRDGQSVRITATGFAANEALTVVQCAAKGTATGPGDCNLSAMQGISADATGRVVTTLVVRKGPFGANNVVCSASTPCLVSVTQASLSPTDEADAPITFAG